MENINELLNLLTLYGGSIVSASCLSDFEINQARASGRMYVDENQNAFVWDPEITFPETDEQVEFFERWYPLEVRPPEGMFDKIMKSIEEKKANHVPFVCCDKCSTETEYYTEIDGLKLCMKCNGKESKTKL